MRSMHLWPTKLPAAHSEGVARRRLFLSSALFLDKEE